MEYAPAGDFVDALSVAVLNRSWPACPFEVHDLNGWVEISTSKMRLKYKLDSGNFGPENLGVSWKDAEKDHAWKPGDVDDKNLGGPKDLESLKNELSPLSRNGYFCLDDSGTAVWKAATHWPEPRNRAGSQDWYFLVYGNEYKKCLWELALLLGPVPMVPRYIFGSWYSDRSGYSSAEWQRIVYRFREEEIPLDIIARDSSSSARVIWHGFGLDPEQFPDPKGFFDWMKARGVKVAVNEHYGAMTPDSDPHFEQIRQTLGLPADTKEIKHDLANQQYAQLYMDVLHKPALDEGLGFWWQDGAAASSMPGLDAMFWTRHIEYTGTERITGKRAFIFCRVGGVWGEHRYGANFSGDTVPRWTLFEEWIPYTVRSGNLLVPYVGNDLPGVYEELIDDELYQRAVQLAAFSPMFRWHSMQGLRLPWEYGDDCFATVKKLLALRYQLLPYIYTYARLAHETGTPLVRGTYLEYPGQDPAYTFTQQYLFGQELLAAPITQPGGGKPVRKNVYLPAGEHWIDYFTGQIYAGDQVLAYECPLDRMPLFVKAGSILPMMPAMDYIEQGPIDPLTLDIYAGKPATFRLYEDDGSSLEYRAGNYAWTPLRYAPTLTAGQYVITIGPTVGRYRAQPSARRYRVQIHGLLRPTRVRLNGRDMAEKWRADTTAAGWVWHQAEQVTVIDLPTPTATKEEITLTLEQAGTFPDAVAVQGVREFRARVRRIRTVQQLRWAMLLDEDDDNCEPRAMQTTEGVEQVLNDLLDHPEGLSARSINFQAMTAEILNALVNQPFAPTRKTPTLDPSFIAGQQHIAQGTFTPDQLHRMTAELLDCKLDASVAGNVLLYKSFIEGPIVRARFTYATALIGPPELAFEFSFPDDGPPGWAELRRNAVPNYPESYAYFRPPDGDKNTNIFSIRAPYPPREGSHTLKLRVTATWGSTQTVLEREVVWTVSEAAANPPQITY